MKRSEINGVVREASDFFAYNGWFLPPEPRWEVTDFGLSDFEKYGLVTVELAREPGYCEKLMYARKGQTTPVHYHKAKKGDIIVRVGQLSVRVWPPTGRTRKQNTLKINGKDRDLNPGVDIMLNAGERVTLEPGMLREFWPKSVECIIGEISNTSGKGDEELFYNPNVRRGIIVDEDEKPLVKLSNERFI